MPEASTRVLASPESIEVLDDLRRIVRALRVASRDSERTLGVSGAQLFVLRSLASGRALSVNELAARTRTHQSTVSVVVKRLVERGLVARAASEVDARRLELRLSRAGKALLERAPLALQDKLIAGIERLPQRERRVLAGSLRGLVAAMQLSDQQPSMFFEDDEPVAKSAPRERSRHGKR